MDLLILIGKCLLIGIIWATFLMPVVFKTGSAIKYIVTVVLVSALTYFFMDYSSIINNMTIIALVGLIVSWITSMAFFDKESRIKAKIIAFASAISGISYMIATLFFNWQIL